MKAIAIKKTKSPRRRKQSSKAFERLSLDFGPSEKQDQKRVIGAVSLLIKLRRGER